MTKEAYQPYDSDRGQSQRELVQIIYCLGQLTEHLRLSEEPVVSPVFVTLRTIPDGAEGIFVDFASGELCTAILRTDNPTEVVITEGLRAKVLGLPPNFGKTLEEQKMVVADLQVVFRSELQERQGY